MTKPRKHPADLVGTIEEAARGLRANREAIERGEVKATLVERAYLDGALDTLDRLLGHSVQT